ELVLNTIAEGLIVVDRDGRLLLSNPAANRMVAPPDPERVYASRGDWGREYGVFSADGNRLLADEEVPLSRALRGELVDGFETFVRNPHVPEGIAHHGSARPLVDADGTVRGAVVCFADVTDRREAEAALAEQVRLATLTAEVGRTLAEA